MPLTKRNLIKGAYYHAYNRGVNKDRIIYDDRDRKTFISCLDRAATECQTQIVCYCLMDNHFHIYLQTPEGNLDKFMWHLQRNHANYMNTRHQRTGAFFQGRYKSRLVDTNAYSLVLIRYIHQNPIMAGMVKNLRDYPWSSYPSYLGLFHTWKWLKKDWFLQQLHANPIIATQMFIEHHDKMLSENEKNLIEKKKRLADSKYIEKWSQIH